MPGIWGGGLNIFFRGRNARQVYHPSGGRSGDGHAGTNRPFRRGDGVPARWGDPARGIPAPKPPTARESHDPRPPLELGVPGPLPLPKEVQEGGPVGG